VGVVAVADVPACVGVGGGVRRVGAGASGVGRGEGGVDAEGSLPVFVEKVADSDQGGANDAIAAAGQSVPVGAE
jgi:hypothetical protein